MVFYQTVWNSIRRLQSCSLWSNRMGFSNIAHASCKPGIPIGFRTNGIRNNEFKGTHMNTKFQSLNFRAFGTLSSSTIKATSIPSPIATIQTPWNSSVTTNANATADVTTQKLDTNVTTSDVKPNIQAEIFKYAKKQQTGVSLKMLADFGEIPTKQKVLQSAQWLLNEIPIRLARQVRYLDKLPYGLCLMPSVRKVRDWYVQSFQELYTAQTPKTMENEQEFTDNLAKIYYRHAPTLVLMAKGVRELKSHIRQTYSNTEVDLSEYVEVHQSLDHFYLARIALRMLIGQHLELHAPSKPDYVGLICKTTSPARVAREAAEDAKFMCMRQHGRAPEVTFHGRTDLTFPYVPSHLYYMLFELLKNSMRATVEFHSPEKPLPPIRLIIADSETNEDVVIKVSDEGGGIARSDIHKIWSYMYTTAKVAFDIDNIHDYPDFGKDAPLAGLGYGLPISRLYARYFAGDLQVMSMEGYGTDAYIFLHRVGDKTEPLP